LLEQGQIGLRSWVAPDLRGRDPCELLPLHGFNFAFPTPNEKNRHEKMEVLISMRGKGEGSHVGFGNVNAKLFPQFARERALRAFTGFDLAAWEFPETRHSFSLGPLRKQQTPITSHKRHRGYEDQRFGAGLFCHVEVNFGFKASN